MANFIPPIPNDKIEEGHPWREWFYQLGNYIQQTQVGLRPWTVLQGGTGANTLTGYVKGNGTNPLTGQSGVPTSDLTGTLSAATMPALTGDVTSTVGTVATTVVKINGTSLATLGTGILKNTTTTGVPSIAVAADFPVLNQNTTGNAATSTTAPSGVNTGDNATNTQYSGLNNIANPFVCSTLRTAGYTVATLPTGTIGMMAYVTDALAPTFLATIVGGGTVITPVFYNGTNWIGG